MFDMLVNLNDDSVFNNQVISSAVPGDDQYRIVRTPGILGDAVADFVRSEFGGFWASETRRSLYSTPSDSYVALLDGRVVGFCAFNATAKAFFGPTGVHHDHRGKGIGRILLINALLTMRSEGYAYAIIGGVDEAAEFYERSVHATRIEGSELYSAYTHMGISF